jgi:hypothetical protein
MTTMSKKTVTISQEHYDQLKASSDKLAALEAAGVDNWEGYGNAMAQLEDDDDE